MTSRSFHATIRYDEEIARWAVRLLAHKAVISYFSRVDQVKLTRFMLTHVLAMSMNLLIAAYIFYSAFFFKPMDLAVILLLLAAAYMAEIPYKNILADMATAFIKSEFTEDELKKITILQMSVALEKKYQAPEMVDTVSGWMGLFRYGLIFLYAFLLLIFIPFTQAALIMLSLAWATRTLSRSSLLADRLVR